MMAAETRRGATRNTDDASQQSTTAGHELEDLVTASESMTGAGSGLTPIDWAEFWSQERNPREWLVEPILPAGRQAAIWASHKTGKSLLALDVAAALASGRSALGNCPKDPITVVYLDFEMTLDDLRDRLADLGYGPADDLSRLLYFQLPRLPPLDSAEGGEALEDIVVEHDPALVILDTMSRVVDGPEDKADTFRAFYRHTGTRLKARGIGLLRLDHGGKDAGRGQRGSSGKGDDVDLVWQLGADTGSGDFRLKLDAGRVPWVPREVNLTRQTTPVLRHVLRTEGWMSGTAEVATSLDRLQVPLNATVDQAVDALRTAKESRRRALVAEALRYRREMVGASVVQLAPPATVPGTPAADGSRNHAEPSLAS